VCSRRTPNQLLQIPNFFKRFFTKRIHKKNPYSNWGRYRVREETSLEERKKVYYRCRLYSCSKCNCQEFTAGKKAWHQFDPTTTTKPRNIHKINKTTYCLSQKKRSQITDPGTLSQEPAATTKVGCRGRRTWGRLATTKINKRMTIFMIFLPIWHADDNLSIFV
jgi:hypothetical protein